MVVPGLVHRYPDRVLLLALDFCSTYCRYCTRSRVVGHGEISPDEKRLERAFEYIAANPQIRDVLISGGDPLAMADHRLDWLLGRLRQIPHLEFVRLGTKMPAVLPQRITPEWCACCAATHPFWMSIHFMHRQSARRRPTAPARGSPTPASRWARRRSDQGRQRRRRDMKQRCTTCCGCGKALLPVPVRSHLGLVALRTTVQKGLEIIAASAVTPAAMPCHLRRRRSRRGGKIRCSPTTWSAATATTGAAQLRGQAVPLPRSAAGGRRGSVSDLVAAKGAFSSPRVAGATGTGTGTATGPATQWQ